MTGSDINKIVCDALAEVQTLSGRDPRIANNSIKPIGELEGFDSLCSVEATVLIESRLGADFGLESIFISEDGNRALTIEEICTRIGEQLAVRAAANG
jgi:acyl carrier protein